MATIRTEPISMIATMFCMSERPFLLHCTLTEKQSAFYTALHNRRSDF